MHNFTDVMIHFWELEAHCKFLSTHFPQLHGLQYEPYSITKKQNTPYKFKDISVFEGNKLFLKIYNIKSCLDIERRNLQG